MKIIIKGKKYNFLETFPAKESGTISPYPTVVIVITAHQQEFSILSNLHFIPSAEPCLTASATS